MEAAVAKPSPPRARRNSKDYICPYSSCELTFYQENRLVKHLRSHTGERPFKCEYEDCSRSYQRKEYLKRHVATSHINSNSPEPKLKCPQCQKEFKTIYSVRKHVKRIHDNKKHKCADCGKLFSKNQGLKVHSYEHTGIKPFNCSEQGCGKSFLLPSKLKAHQKIHEGYSCKAIGCQERFSAWSLLRKHTKANHPPQYKCNNCERIFCSKSKLKLHNVSHAEMRESFLCPYDNCPRYYYYRKYLMDHIRLLHEGRRHRCEHEGCDKTFSNRHKLTLHQKVHDPNANILQPKKRSIVRKRRSLAFQLSGHQGTVDEERILLGYEIHDEPNGHHSNADKSSADQDSFTSEENCRENHQISFGIIESRIGTDIMIETHSNASVFSSGLNSLVAAKVT